MFAEAGFSYDGKVCRKRCFPGKPYFDLVCWYVRHYEKQWMCCFRSQCSWQSPYRMATVNRQPFLSRPPLIDGDFQCRFDKSPTTGGPVVLVRPILVSIISSSIVSDIVPLSHCIHHSATSRLYMIHDVSTASSGIYGITTDLSWSQGSAAQGPNVSPAYSFRTRGYIQSAILLLAGYYLCHSSPSGLSLFALKA